MAIDFRIVLGPIAQTDAAQHTANTTGDINAGETAVLLCQNSTYDKGTGFANGIISIDNIGGGTWTQDVRNPGIHNGGTSFVVEAWSSYIPNGFASGGAVTQYSDTGHTSPTWMIFAMTGMGTVPNQSDRFSGGTGNSSQFTTNPASQAITPDADNAIVFGQHHGNHNNAPFWTPSSGWTEIADYGGTSFTESGSSFVVQYQIQTTATSVSTRGTATSAETWANAIVAYKAGVAGQQAAAVAGAGRFKLGKRTFSVNTASESLASVYGYGNR